MNDGIKQNLQESSIWKRALYMLLFALFYSVAEMVLFAVVIFQFLFKLITGETNKRLLDFGQSLATYFYQILQFLNFNTEHHPYPFAEWPQGKPADDSGEGSIEEDTSAASVVEEPVEKLVEDSNDVDEADDSGLKADDSTESDRDDKT
jgi:hypothetical protein